MSVISNRESPAGKGIMYNPAGQLLEKINIELLEHPEDGIHQGNGIRVCGLAREFDN